MSSVVIPKEQLSAYQRWELASLDDGSGPGVFGSEAAATTLPTCEQLQKLRDDARMQGYADGFEEGRRAGQAEGRRQSSVLAEQLAHLAEAFGAELARADELVADAVLDLALDLAKAMLKVGLEIRPELVLPVVSQAIHYLPALQPPAILHLHPEDAALVKEHLGDELAKAGWRVAGESTIERGGCRIETASNQIDATVGTRWQRIASALAKTSDWLS